MKAAKEEKEGGEERRYFFFSFNLYFWFKQPFCGCGNSTWMQMKWLCLQDKVLKIDHNKSKFGAFLLRVISPFGVLISAVVTCPKVTCSFSTSNRTKIGLSNPNGHCWKRMNFVFVPLRPLQVCAVLTSCQGLLRTSTLPEFPLFYLFSFSFFYPLYIYIYTRCIR